MKLRELKKKFERRCAERTEINQEILRIRKEISSLECPLYFLHDLICSQCEKGWHDCDFKNVCTGDPSGLNDSQFKSISGKSSATKSREILFKNKIQQANEPDAAKSRRSA